VTRKCQPSSKDKAHYNYSTTTLHHAIISICSVVWTGLSAEESIRMTEDMGKWRKYVHGVANRRIEDG